MDIKEKLSTAYVLLYEVRKERNAPFDEFNDDPLANTLLHAMCDIKEAHDSLMFDEVKE